MPPPPSAEYFAVLEPIAPAKFELEMYLDYTCPFCAKIYPVIYNELIPKLQGDGIPARLVFKHIVQPWHPQSTLLHEAALAVKRLCGTDKFFEFSAILFKRQKEFFDANVWGKSREEITTELVTLAADFGVDESALAGLLALKPDVGDGSLNRGTELTNVLKLAVKEARQRSVHVSPTCAVNGILIDSSSSWTVQQWEEYLGPLLNA